MQENIQGNIENDELKPHVYVFFIGTIKATEHIWTKIHQRFILMNLTSWENNMTCDSPIPLRGLKVHD